MSSAHDDTPSVIGRTLLDQLAAAHTRRTAPQPHTPKRPDPVDARPPLPSNLRWSTDPCRACGGHFILPKRRGRPTVVCDPCRSGTSGQTSA